MADPLSLLRQYCMKKREIIEKDGMICFGEYCWPKQTKTNYLIYSSQRDGPNKNYYTLECLVYFLKHKHLQHPTYVKQAASYEIPIVQRPDRKDLLAYLQGEVSTSASIDKSAPIELPFSISQLNTNTQNAQNNLSRSTNQSSMLLDGDGPTSNKMPRWDEVEKVRKQFAERLDAPKIKKLPADILSATKGNKIAGDSANTTSLRDSMTNEQIVALKAKRLAKKRSTIIDADANDIEGNQGSLNNQASVHSVLLQYDSNFTKEIQNKERVWRNRSNILQSTGKDFQTSVFNLLNSIKSREESSLRFKSGLPLVPSHPKINNSATALPSASNNLSSSASQPAQQSTQQQQQQAQQQQQQYNRYDQERFSKNDSALGFSIDTTGTYHGLTLKSVTEGPQPAHKAALSANQQSQHHHHHSHHHQQSKHLSTNNTGVGQNQKPQKRVPRTPIIIIPATNTSLITMFNAKSLLQDLIYIDSRLCDQKPENEILIQRRKHDNTTVPYRIINNPTKLTQDEWHRVVAVFVQGPAWQFKNWPWDGNPVEIFARIKAFHLKFDEMKLDNNVAKWSVEIIELSRSKRHLDRANLLKFWSLLDQHIQKHKHNVVRY